MRFLNLVLVIGSITSAGSVFAAESANLTLNSQSIVACDGGRLTVTISSDSDAAPFMSEQINGCKKLKEKISAKIASGVEVSVSSLSVIVPSKNVSGIQIEECDFSTCTLSDVLVHQEQSEEFILEEVKLSRTQVVPNSEATVESFVYNKSTLCSDPRYYQSSICD
jgi:hypothetical protein